MKLSDYLNRINYSGSQEPNKEVLFALHRAHLNAIAYENLDIHLGNPVTVDLEQIFEKIVRQGRGGWCFEMNGLFAWALHEIGFDVTMVAGTVGRAGQTDVREGDHLILCVTLDQPYLADVGFGVGFFEPLPLAAGTYQQDFIEVSLRQVDQIWHFDNVPGCGPGYDFSLTPKRLADFANACHWLQTAPESGFVKTTVCHRVQPGKITSMRGRVLVTVTASEGTSPMTNHLMIHNKDDYAQTLETRFGLSIEKTTALWDRVCANHERWLRSDPNALSYLKEVGLGQGLNSDTPAE